MTYTPEQWDLIDQIPERDLLKYLEILSESKLLSSSDWLQLCQILNIKKRFNSWTVKQRRWCTLKLLDHWDYISFISEL
jgi:hypothetical protein